MPISASYDPQLVVLSVVVASLASHVALDLAGRTRDARRGRLAWLTAASVVMGVGIWSMHFIGMFALAFETDGWPMQIGYQQGQLAGSLLVAIAGSVLALGIASRKSLSMRALLASGLLMGGAIAWMYYIGMSAVVMAATIQYSPSLIALALGIAVLVSTLALALARPGEAKTTWEQWAERAASVVMGVAIAGMHYTAMAAARFTPTGDGMMTMTGSMLGNAVLGTSDLVLVVAVSALAVLTIGLVVGALDRQHGRRLAARMQVGEARYRSLTQSATDAILSADAQGRIVSWNLAAEKIFGFSESEILARPLITLVSPEHHVVWANGITSLADETSAPSFGRTVEFDGVRRDGRVFPMEVALSQWVDGNDRFVTGIIRDITERKVADAALRESERRFRNVVEQSPEAIVLHADGVLLYANPAAASLIGVNSSAELSGRPFVSIVHPGSQDVVTSRRSVSEDGRRHEMLQYQLLHHDGRAIDVEARSVPSTFNGAPAVQTHLRDVTSQKVLEAQLAHQAFHDALTGLANRALFRDRVDHAIARSARRGAAPAVLFLDLDNFKAINDGLGHGAGDELLCTVARRLHNVMRASDTCARLGGDEFAVLIEEPPDSPDSGAHAAHIAERMISALNTVCGIGGAEVGVTVSVGIAVARRGETGDELLRNADLAMYRAKSNGKNRYEMFEPAMHDVVRKRLELESELRRAIDQCAAFTHEKGMKARTGEQPPFVVYYQAIASLDTSEVRSFEALVRWVHPTRGLVPPLDFIPIAEETGLIVPLGRWILREACTQARRWQETGCQGLDAGQVGVTINLSARQLLQNELPDDVRAALDVSGLAPESLTLEMTESMLIDDSEATLGRLRALKALGVRLAIDDFGTGYSSLAYLERFPVDLLKIDRSFVDKIGLGEGESPLARAILGLGRELGMRVVAEGIETEAQWTRLRELGCELGQGYYLARPKPANELGRVQRGGVAA